ncbi:MAG: ParA family protein [Planctomycetota bacterium]|nr:ParA family protein [Planctomycetota bacterium]
MTKIYSVINEKGGTGKSSTAVHLAVGLAKRGRKVLVCDLDPQGNSSHFFTGIIKHQRGLASGLIGLLTAEEIALTTQYKDLDILPGGPELADTNTKLMGELCREFKLKNLLEGFTDKYDNVIIDTAPTRSILTTNVIVATNTAIIAVHPGTWDLHGFQSCLENINSIRVSCKVEIKIGLLLSRMTRNKVSKDAEAMLRKNFPTLVYRQTIPESTKIQEALGRQLTAFEHTPDHAAAQAFTNFLNEIIINEQSQQRVA